MGKVKMTWRIKEKVKVKVDQLGAEMRHVSFSHGRK